MSRWLLSDATRIGLIGGTFDPVHYGHLRPALEMADQFKLDVLYLVPNHRPAHRNDTTASTAQRITMLQLAVADVPLLEVDTRDALRDRPTYTVDTLQELRDENPDASLIFGMGLDAFAEFDQWHQWEMILALANLVVMSRPEAAHSQRSAAILERQRDALGEHLNEHQAGVIATLDVTRLSISATVIRELLKGGKNVRFLLPDRVREYIDAHELYR